MRHYVVMGLYQDDLFHESGWVVCHWDGSITTKERFASSSVFFFIAPDHRKAFKTNRKEKKRKKQKQKQK